MNALWVRLRRAKDKLHLDPGAEKIQREFTIRHNHEGDAWPAARFVRLVSRLKCNVTVAQEGREVDGTSVMALLELRAAKGCKIRIHVEGSDAAKAVLKIDNFLKSFDREP
jgi:phosphotransferase system HPr (HPr) family protein